MTALGSVRGVFVVAFIAVGWGYGCGRTSLDEGFGPAGLGGAPGIGGAGVAGISGAGGRSGLGGNVGLGGSNAPNPCGTTFCMAATQTCCLHLNSTPPTPTCIPSGTTCNGGIATACISSANCGTGQVCCVTLQTLATTCQSSVQCAGNGQFIVCSSSAGCPAATPRCCEQVQGLGLCLPTGVPCPAPR